MNGPRCPACGARVRMPKNAPLPPPHMNVKCPSCGSIGKLEAFLRAASGEEERAVATVPVAEAVAVGASVSGRSRSDAGTGTRISGSASRLDLPAGLRCALTVISGPDRGKKLAVDKPRVVVGRQSGDLPLSDPEVSSQHCAFELTGVTCTVKDLDSKNGTWVDGERITRASLGTVGEVVVGATTILFTMTLEDSLSPG